FQCENLAPDEYHVHEELQFVEIDPITRELVTTNLDRTYMPVIRMKTGDMAEFVDRECPCRRSVRIIRLLGRTSERVKLGGELFDPSLCKTAADVLGLPRDAWQVKV